MTWDYLILVKARINGSTCRTVADVVLGARLVPLCVSGQPKILVRFVRICFELILRIITE